MCTAATYLTGDFYFGRNLDYEFSYGDEVTITPRNYPFHFRSLEKELTAHYAMIGMAYIAGDYPLYYDAVNEKGLCIAGLNFVGNAAYQEPVPEKDNVAQFELIPWLLGQCASVKEARELIARMNLTNIPFSEKLPLAQLHWLISDRTESITLEAMKDGLHVYDNPVGVLTNNPPFPYQMFQLNNYMQLSPGDLSSQSRFIRAAFTKMNACSGDSEEESVSQFFHILTSVEQQRGCCLLENGKYEITLYSSCCNADKGIYYYTTYDNRQISAVYMNHEDLESSTLVRYPIIQKASIHTVN